MLKILQALQVKNYTLIHLLKEGRLFLKYFFCLFLGVVFHPIPNAKAQFHLPDSLLPNAIPAKNIVKNIWNARYRFIFKFDNRSSFINQTRVQLLGVKTGISYHRHEFGAGIVMMPPQLDYTSIINEQPIKTEVVLRYFDLYYQYRIYKNGNFSIELPISIGIGRGGFKTTHLQTDEESYRFRRLAFIEPSAVLYYKIIPFTSIGGGLGYRKAFSRDEGTSNRFTAPIYTIKLKIELGQIAKTIYLRKKKVERGYQGSFPEPSPSIPLKE